MAATVEEPRVSALYIYPIKSCKGIALQSAVLTKQGLYYDRQWMVIKAATGRFVTQRETAKMALVGVSLPAEALAGDWGKLPPGAAMEVTAPGMPPLLVPLATEAPLQTRQATVWEWTGTTADAGDDAAEWFTQFLGVPARLVRYLGSAEASEQVPNTVRHADQTFALDYEVRFTDGFPMLLATEAALADLNSKIKGPPLLMNRFRANIIVGGTEPWAEDSWRGVKVLPRGSGTDAAAQPLELTAVKPCSRCKVTTIDQATAEAGDEPLDTLGTIRSGKVLGWNSIQKSWTHAVFFGWNCVSRSTGRISVGDVVAVSQPHNIAIGGLTPAA